MPHNPAAPPAPVTPPQPSSGWAGLTSISVGSGLVLVFFPSAALYFGHARLGGDPLIGLPTVAIFGILILLGALALVSTMFARLDMGNRDEALGLPAGSIRAVIAMSLIVLFALMSVMLFHTLSRSTQTLEGLSLAAKNELTADRTNHVLAIKPVQCPAEAASAPTAAATAARAQPAAAATPPSGPAAAASAAATVACGKGEAFSYTVTLGNTQGAPAVDFAKQLLTLIGALMTSVVSFYFAARSADQSVRTVVSAMAGRSGPPGGTSHGGAGPAGGSEDEADHEHGGVRNATDDKDLPPAKGGVTT